MCGITGYVGLNLSQNQLKQTIQVACNQIRHRGPDAQNYFTNTGVALGITRLEIRDPIHGKQPLSHQGITIVFNGELYNTAPLQATLEKRGYKFKTECDTEVFLYAFIEYGSTMLAKLTGMFAFAIWDSKKKTLYLGRDRWGEKPLYFTTGEGFIAFASEISALKTWPNIQWNLSLKDLNTFLKHSYIPGSGTGWTNIFKIQPRTILTWHNGHYTHTTYVSPKIHPTTEVFDTENESKKLYRLLKTSVKNCLVSDKPIGIFLSGGLDSTTIAYLASQHTKNLSLFSIDWDAPHYSEGKYIKEAVDYLGLNHFKAFCTPLFFQNHFEYLADIYGEPFADESMFPCYCLAKLAKNSVDVVLTGDGADEFFHGYERYFFPGSYEQYLNVFSSMPDEVKEFLYSEEMQAISSQESDLIYTQYLRTTKSCSNPRIRSWVDINTYLPFDILTKIDRATMAVGLEARAPFLTPEVTDFALHCSTQSLIGIACQGKQILRHAMKNHLPKTILERKKLGFGMPLNEWFRSSLKEWMQSRLMGNCLIKTGWFSKKGIEKLISDHLSEQKNSARIILNLLILDNWIQKNT